MVTSPFAYHLFIVFLKCESLLLLVGFLKGSLFSLQKTRYISFAVSSKYVELFESKFMRFVRLKMPNLIKGSIFPDGNHLVRFPGAEQRQEGPALFSPGGAFLRTYLALYLCRLTSHATLRTLNPCSMPAWRDTLNGHTSLRHITSSALKMLAFLVF